MLPVNNYILDFKTSCSREEAVGKMLGWLRGPIRWDPQYVSTLVMREEYLTYFPNETYSLKDHFDTMREAAINNVINVFDNPESSKSDRERVAAELMKCDELILKAANFFISIDDELAKGEDSALRIDHRESNKTGELQITLKSLDNWALDNHKISIINETEGMIDKDSLMQGISEAQAPKARSQVRPEHLYVTFAFLLEAFVVDNKTQKYIKGDKGELNVSAIARRLETDISRVNGNQRLHGLSEETIKTIIENAMKNKKAVLPISSS